MPYKLTLEELNLFINRIVLIFLDSFELEDLETNKLTLDNTDPTFYLRSLLLLKRILGEEIPYPFIRFYKELLIIATLEELRANYIDYYIEKRSKFYTLNLI